MSGLVVFNEKNLSLGKIDFIKSATNNQIAIKNCKNSYEITKQISMFITSTSNVLGIKDAVSDIDKNDISELILTKYKSLSFDEIHYAFKMERYGNLGERTKHFQLFNVEYVSSVLDKWKDHKREIKVKHNISKLEQKNELSESEKQMFINNGVTECIEYYEEKEALMDGKIYVYDVFYDLGFLPTDLEYKNRIKKDAVEVLEFEYSTRKATSKEEKKEFKFLLNDIKNPKTKNGKLINKCKELVLLEFFRKVFKDVEKIEELKIKFKN